MVVNYKNEAGESFYAEVDSLADLPSWALSPVEVDASLDDVWSMLTHDPIQDLKRQRTSAVNNIKVTINNGKTFDGDERSQERMARTLIALGDSGNIPWKLADNTFAYVTPSELREALLMAGARQTEIWQQFG